MTSTTTGTPAGPPEAEAEAPAAPAGRGAPWWRLALPALLLGAASALHRLDHRALWLDEAYTLGSVHQLRSAVPRTSWTMSAYYAVMRVWLLVSESVWWMRALSVVAALGAVAATVAVARRLAGPREAAMVGVATVLSPLWLVHAQEARSYPFVVLAVAGTWLALDHGLSDGDAARRRLWWWLHTGLALVLPLLHGLTLLQLLPQAVVLLGARADRSTWGRALRGLGLAAVLTAVLARTASSEVGSWVDPLGRKVVELTLERFLSRWAWVCAALVVVVLLGAAACVGAARRAPSPLDRARALVPVLWGLAPLVLLVLVSVVRPSLVPRYAIGSVPGVALLMVAAVERLGRSRWRAPVARAVAAVAVAVALGAGHVHLHTRPPDGWTVAVDRVAAGLRPGDTILLSREATTRPPFEAAWRDVEPAADPVLLPSDRPLGEVLRFEPDQTPGTVRWNEARRAGRIWLVGDSVRLELDRLPWLTVDGVARRPATHREVGRWRAPRSSIWVVLLEPVPADG